MEAENSDRCAIFRDKFWNKYCSYSFSSDGYIFLNFVQLKNGYNAREYLKTFQIFSFDDCVCGREKEEVDEGFLELEYV